VTSKSLPGEQARASAPPGPVDPRDRAWGVLGIRGWDRYRGNQWPVPESPEVQALGALATQGRWHAAAGEAVPETVTGPR